MFRSRVNERQAIQSTILQTRASVFQRIGNESYLNNCLIWQSLPSVIEVVLFLAELKPCDYCLEHVFYLDFAIFSNMSHVHYLDQWIFIMIHVYCLDCVEFYLSHVLTKFLIVGRDLCSKNQSHEYYLVCVKSISEP